MERNSRRRDRSDEVLVTVIDHDLDDAGARRAHVTLRDAGTALAHTVVVDATRVGHIGARGLLLLEHWVQRWQALNLKVTVLASHQVARAVAAAGAAHVVHVTRHPEHDREDGGAEIRR